MTLLESINGPSDLKKLNPDILKQLLPIKEGQDYEDQKIESATDSLTFAAGAAGFAFVDVRPEYRANPEKHTVDVTFQVTAVFEVLITDATNGCLPPTATMATLGMTLTCTCATVTVAEAERVGSAADTAVTLTVAGVGMVAGALYSPKLEIVPTVGLPPTRPLTCQLTAVLAPALTTVAVKA